MRRMQTAIFVKRHTIYGTSSPSSSFSDPSTSSTSPITPSSNEAASMAAQIVRDIDMWVEKNQPHSSSERKKWIKRPHAGALMKEEAAFIKERTHIAYRLSPNAYFYKLYKLHKNPVKTRPVCSTCGSIAEAIGKYVDELLRPIAQSQSSYFRDSTAFKQRLDKVCLPPNAQLFTMDATAIYSNICSEAALKVLSEYLRRPSTMERFEYNADCLIEAISIVLIDPTLSSLETSLQATRRVVLPNNTPIVASLRPRGYH